jgi:hypothetical protein
MAQYDLLLIQNVHATLTEFTERAVHLSKGDILSADTSHVPTVLAAGTDGYMLVRSDAATTGLAWQVISGGHTQNTDTGTTETIFHIDSDGYAIELTAASASKFDVKVSGGATYADLQAKDATFASLTLDDLKAAGTASTADLWSEVTTGSITLGAGITTGTVNIAAAGTGASSINIGHTNATIYLVGSIDTPILSAVALGTNSSGVVAAASTTGSGTTLVLGTTPTFTTSVIGGASFDVFDTASTTVNAFGAATTLTLGFDGTGASTTNFITGAITTGLTKTINIGTAGATGSTTNINIATAGAGTAAMNVNLGSASGGTVTVNKDLVVTGDLTVNGTTTTINATTLTVDDKNIEIGSVASPSDTTADGGGITLRGLTDKTILWDNANDNWSFNQSVNLETGLTYKIANTTVLSATQVLGVTLGTMASATATDYVAKALYDANTILYATSDNTPAALTVGEQTLVGRVTSGAIAALTAAQAMGVLWQTAPAAKGSTGTLGQIAKDDNYFYICTATNTWKRSAIATNW